MRVWPLLFLAACKGAPIPSEDAGLTLDASVSEEAGFVDAERDAEPIDANDAAVGDDATPDATPDTGFDPCGPPGGACERADDCAADHPPPTNCETCVPYNDALCANGTCETPAVLGGGDLYNIIVEVPVGLPALQSFSIYALGARTAGGATLTCADLYEHRVELGNVCLNVLTTRAYILGQPGQTYVIGFAGFTGEQHTLFVIRGHTEVQARGDPVGISCTEVDVGPPTGGGPYLVMGDRMRAP